MIRDIKKDMFDYVPRYYSDIKESVSILDTESKEFEVINKQINMILDQFFVNKATFGLYEWENMVGIVYPKSVVSNWWAIDTSYVMWDQFDLLKWDGIGKAYGKMPALDERRSNIKAKLRGKGTVTNAHLKSVVESYTNGNVEISEDYANYEVSIVFADNTGVPPNYEDAKNAVLNIIPAHINVLFMNKYSLWSDVKSTQTWGSIKDNTWQDIKGGLY